MEANNRAYRHDDSRTSYVEGNTVRKLNTVPVRREEQYEVPSPRRQDNRQTKTLSGINMASFFVLAVAILATVFVCIDYVRVQSDINRLDNKITAKQEKLITLTKNNDAASGAINKEYDLEYVYHMAVEKYGMVYPKDSKVITYKSSDDDYVRQFADIPQ